MVKYFMLDDYKNRGTIVKTEGRKHYEFIKNEWVHTGVMMEYFWPDSPAYGLYKEISKDEARELLKKYLQENNLDTKENLKRIDD